MWPEGDSGTFRQYLALDDEILRSGLGPDYADKVEGVGMRSTGPLNQYARTFRRAQRKVERRHLRDRNMLLHHEKERKKMQREMGQDPFLDTAVQYSRVPLAPVATRAGPFPLLDHITGGAGEDPVKRLKRDRRV